MFNNLGEKSFPRKGASCHSPVLFCQVIPAFKWSHETLLSKEKNRKMMSLNLSD